MSALDELRNKKTPPTELELCILMAGSLEDPEKAAEELKALQADRERLSKEKNEEWLQLLGIDHVTGWLEHVAGVGSPIEIKLINGGTHTIEASPHYFTDCETCKQIAEYLARYHGESEQ